jgi:hypothetical protein
MKPYKYINRYNDIFTFTPLDENTLLMEGDFKYIRIGWPNDYSIAYEKYIQDGGELPMEEFQKVVHDYNDDKGEFKFPKYIPLITSDTTKIKMIDPSGGPYVGVGMPSNLFHPEIKDKVIENIINDEKGYKLILK